MSVADNSVIYVYHSARPKGVPTFLIKDPASSGKMSNYK